MQLLRNVRSTRAGVLLAVILIHVAVLYAIAHAPARVTQDGPPMFRPAVADTPQPAEQGGIHSRAWQPPVVDAAPDPLRDWHFPRIDIWPVNGNACPTPSEFGPLMGAEPVADAAQPVLQRASAHPEVIPKRAKPRMVIWQSPFYTLESVRTEMEGTARLAFNIRPTGDVDELQVERSSGSEKLDAAAAQAAKAWRFTPAMWRGRPVQSRATVDLTFNFYEFHVSALDEQSASAPARRGSGKIDPPNRIALVRRFVDALRAGTTGRPDAPVYTSGQPPWPATMRGWGPISGVQYLGPIGRPEWRRYDLKKSTRTASHANSAVVRWELYRVVHEDHAAYWELGMDRTARVWAIKAEPLDFADRAEKPVIACPVDSDTTG